MTLFFKIYFFKEFLSDELINYFVEKANAVKFTELFCLPCLNHHRKFDKSSQLINNRSRLTFNSDKDIGERIQQKVVLKG